MDQYYECISYIPLLWFFQKESMPSEITNIDYHGNCMEIKNISKYNAGKYYCYGYDKENMIPFLARTLLIVAGM